MYKCKDKKILPQNVALPDGIKPGENITRNRLETMIRELNIEDKLEIGKGLKVLRGLRLTLSLWKG
jgi:hypothetical protein